MIAYLNLRESMLNACQILLSKRVLNIEKVLDIMIKVWQSKLNVEKV